MCFFLSYKKLQTVTVLIIGSWASRLQLWESQIWGQVQDGNIKRSLTHFVPETHSSYRYIQNQFSSVQSLSRVRLFETPWSTAHPDLPVCHQLPESTKTHVHWVGDVIQPSHPLSSPSPPALNPSQHQGLFKWVSSSHQVAKILEFQLQHQSFQWTPRTDLL